MSDPTDINENDPADDERLSALYDRASTEQPSKSVDAAILKKAQANQPSKQLSYFPGWRQSFSVAAVLILSVTVVLMIEKESPVLPSISESVVVIDQKTNKQEAVVEQEKFVLEKTTPKERLTNKPDRLEEKRQLEPQGRLDKDSAPAVAPVDSPSIMSNIAKSDTALSFKAAAPGKEKTRKKQETTLQERDADLSHLARSAQAPKAVMGIAADQPEQSFSDDKSCQQLTEKACLTSAACTLKKTKEASGYECLPAKDHCELLFRQNEGTKEICESKQGCEFVPGQCYCPPDVLCVCGGGEPPLCRSKIPE